jgi:cytochrome c oxidase cbb3-type subunit 1
MHPFYAMRAVGGLIFFLGGVVMLYNVTVTIRRAIAKPSPEMATAANI